MTSESTYRCIQRVIVSTQTTAEKILENAFRNPLAWDGICITTYAGISETPRDTRARFLHIRDAAQKFRTAGIPVQLGISFTLGHGDSPLCPEVTVPPMVGPGGETCRNSLCPRSAEAGTAFESLFGMYASINPECIWVDDDFRMFFHPPAICGCFCEKCIQRFNREYGHSHTRESLVQSLLEDHFPAENELRRQWLEFNHAALRDLMRTISRAVHRVNPDIIIGLMTAGAQFNTYDLPDYHDFLPVMANSRGEAWFRPGAFFYDDSAPFQAVNKAFALSVTNRFTSGPDTRAYSEIVMCPYNKRVKALKIVRFEALLHLGLGGVNGLTFESIKENIDEMDAYLRMVQENGPYFQAISDAIQGHTQIGLFPWFSAEAWRFADAGNSMEDLHADPTVSATELLKIGLPLTADPDGALGLLLIGGSVKSMPEKDLESWLGKGILADADAADWLRKKTGRDCLGVTIAGPALSTCETFTDHPLNGLYSGYFRCAYAGTSGKGAREMHLAGAAALSETVSGIPGSRNYQKKDGGIGCAAYTTAEGGRSVVMAAAPWASDIVSYGKSTQIRNAVRWICGELPVWLESDCRVGQSIWKNEKDTILFLFNMDYDTAADIRIHFDSCVFAERLLPDGTWKPFAEGTECTLPILPDFDVCILRLVSP